MRSNKIRVFVLVAMGLASPVALAGGGLTGGATLPEQIVQEGTLVEQLAKQAQQLTTEIEQYENMIQNMEQIPQSLMSQINQAVDSLASLENEAQNLAMAGQNISSQFAQMQVGQSQQEADMYANQYSQISQNLSNAINNALQTANMNPSDFTTVAQADQTISNALNNPQSRNALLQGAVAAGQATVTQVTQLVQTTNAMASLQAEQDKKRLARENADRQAALNAWEAFNSGTVTTNTPPLSDYTP